MKILLLNHYIDAQHKISARLQSVGAILLSPTSVEEAWNMIQLHGASLDLAVIHRESRDGAEDEGEQLVSRVKADPSQADLPIIFTSSLWNETDFYQHQQGPSGANAYLRWPFDDEKLIETIETMFGNSIRFAANTMTATHPRLSAAGLNSGDGGTLPNLSGMSVVLEEASDPSSVRIPAAELNLDAPAGTQPGLVLSTSQESPAAAPAENADASAISLVVPEPGLSLEPVDATSGGLVLADSPVANLDVSKAVDVSKAMNEELEPHERLELDLQLKESAGGTGPIAMDAPIAASPSAPFSDDSSEGGTMVLDASAGLPPAIAEEPKTAPKSAADDDELISDLPYLFPRKSAAEKASSALVFAEPVGDAVIPGGASQSPDIETLKKYLMLREQDVAVLSNQLKAAREQGASLEKRLREETGKSGELDHLVSEQAKRIDEFEKEKTLALQGLQGEIDELRFQNKAKTDKARLLELKVHEATEEIERLKERVRNDIRKIRVREKELENKLEIVRKDSEALITARETKIMELKRKIDLLEFNIDLLQDQNAREKENSAQLRERLAKAAQVVRVAGGLLDTPGKSVSHAVADGDMIIEKKGAREAS